MTPVPGELFEDRYLITELIGEGGFASVYRATDQRMQREVALKVFSSKEGQYAPDRVSRFLREARVAGTLQDPHIVAMYDFGKSSSGLLYLVFEFVEGRDLRSVLFNDGPIAPMAVLHILEQLLQALREAHSKGVLHRDIKPANVLMFRYADDPHRVKLADFGIAKPVAADATNITQAGRLVGTFRYMSPEQALGIDLDGRTDIFSLGLVAYEMFDARRAINADARQDILREIVNGEPILVPESWAPPALARVVERMLEREHTKRYRNVDEVLRDLRAARSSLRIGPKDAEPPDLHSRAPIAAPSAPRDAPPDHVRPRSRVALILAASSVGTAALILVVSLIPVSNDDPPASPLTQPARTNPLAVVERASATVPIADVGLQPTDLARQPVGSPGCGRPPPGYGMQSLTSLRGLEEVHVRAYVPKNYDPDVPHPVLVIFHGIKQAGFGLMSFLGLDGYADRTGMVILMPQSAKGVVLWDPDTMLRAHESLNFAKSQLCLDPGRILTFGHSLGGVAAHQFACGLTEKPAGVAIAGFRFDEADMLCDPRAPYLMMSPLNDGRAPVNGGTGCLGFTPLRTLAKQESDFRKLQGCSDGSPKVSKHRAGVCSEWDCAEPLTTCHLDGGRQFALEHTVVKCEGKPSKFPYGKVTKDFFDRSLQRVD